MKDITRIALFMRGAYVRVRISKIRDLRTQRFDRLTPLRFIGIRNCNRIWECACDCGVVREIRECNLISGQARDCGCASRAQRRAWGYRNRTHGMSDTRVYSLWKAMIKRCENPHMVNYQHYGGRGIKVCKRWHKFENFYSDMGDRPTPAHTLDRVDNDGDYCKENCRWATWKEQRRNTRANRMLTFRGKTMCVSEWSEKVGISASTIYRRLRLGYSAQEVFQNVSR